MVISLRVFKPHVKQETPDQHYPIGSTWELEYGERTVVFDVLAHNVFDGISAMCVEYQRWDSVGGWVGSGYAEWLEVAFEDGGFVLYTFTDAQGIKAA